MLRSIFALLAAALFLASCAEEHPTPVAVPQSASTIAIVSSIPPQIRIATTGLTVVENALDVVDVPDWHLDDVAANAATAALSSRYKVVRPQFDGWLADTDTKLDKAVNKTAALTTQVRNHVHTDTPVDLYLVISLGNTAQPYTQMPDVLFGVGVSKMRHIFYTLPPVAHIFLQLTILDGKTYDVIATTPLEHTPRSSGAVLGLSQSSPTEGLTGFDWKDSWREMSDAQHDQIHVNLTTLLAQSVTYTIKEMQLAP